MIPATPPAGPGLVLVNPPYGERLSSDEDLWRRLGDLFKQRYKGYKAAVLAGGEPQLVVREGVAHAARLVPATAPDAAPGYRRLTAFPTSSYTTVNEYKWRASYSLLNASIVGAGGVRYVGTQLVVTGAECPACRVVVDPATSLVMLRTEAEAAADPFSLWELVPALDGTGDRGVPMIGRGDEDDVDVVAGDEVLVFGIRIDTLVGAFVFLGGV